jgi:hypothetical protein
MKAWMAIATTLGIIVATLILVSIVNAVAGNGDPEARPGDILGFLVIICSAIWVGIDAHRIETRKYQLNGVCRFIGQEKPITAAIGCLFLWVIAFPIYLITKGQITRGEIPLKQK